MISVIIPAFNREAYLGKAIESVLAQTQPPDEIVVVDDGSTDGTVDVARSFGEKVRWISQENQGIGGARNTGMKMARGNLIAFLDSDDMWRPEKLERQARCLREYPEVAAVFCRTKPFLSPEPTSNQPLTFDDREMDALLASALLMRREIYEQVGDFTNIRLGEFIEWFGRATDLGFRHHVVPDLLLDRRVHTGNSVSDRAQANVHYTRILKARLDRHRNASSPSH